MPACSTQRCCSKLTNNLPGLARMFLVVIVALISASAFAQSLVSITVTQIFDPSSPTTLGAAALRQFIATGNYSDGSQQYLTQQVTWSSENTSIATVTPTMGLVTAVAAGTVNIDATLSGIVGTSSLTVITRTQTGVAIAPLTWSMKIGATQQYYATAYFGDATIQDATSTATWTSSTPSVATVSSSGLVTALAAGTTTITATYNKFKGSTTLTVTSGTPTNLGLWSQPQSLGMLAIHAAMLHTGQVLFWGYPVGRHGGPSPARLYNPIANSITDVTIPWNMDIFCAGQVILQDGRVLVDGGTDDGQYPADSGIANTTIFDPSTNSWSQGPNMTYTRWYPTVLTLPNGNVLAASGTANNGVTIQQAMEEYNPTTNAWTVLPTSANIANPVDLYPFFSLLRNGEVLYAGPRQNSTIFNLMTNTWSFVANLNLAPRDHGAEILFPSGQKVMLVGGAQSDVNGGASPTNTTETIDFTQATPAWSYGTPLNIARYNANVIYLADGSLLAIGGGQNGHYASPVFQPESYNFNTSKWTLMAPQSAVRAYHSTAVLLPDGRVISAGSDSGTALENTYEIYSPPYLFKGARPTITSAPSSFEYGNQFTVTTPSASTIKSVALIRPGATTHADHMDDHRYVNLTFTVGSGQLTVTAPANSNIAPPGYYYLVILNGSGIPSIMPFVQLQ